MILVEEINSSVFLYTFVYCIRLFFHLENHRGGGKAHAAFLPSPFSAIDASEYFPDL